MKFLKNKKNLLFVLLIFVAFLGILVLLLQRQELAKQKQMQAQQDYLLQQQENLPAGKRSANPLINSQTLSNIKSEYNKKLMLQNIPTPTVVNTRFRYKLDSSLRSNLLNPVAPVLAASCNLDAFGSTVPVYTLKINWDETEAQAIAQEYEINSAPSSLPAPGGSYQYFFSNPVTNGYLSMYQASGMYNYHKVLGPAEGSISMDEAKLMAGQELMKHNLYDNLLLENSEYIAEINSYVFKYTKNWNGVTVVDEVALKGLGGSSVCDINDSDQYNVVEVIVTQDGQLSKLINYTRKELEVVTADKLSLEEAINTYPDDTIAEPVIVGTPIEAGEVTIDEAVLVYFDYGDTYPQNTYTPIYLTSGTVTDGMNTAQVINLFPAVSMDTLAQEGITAEVNQTLKLGTFDFPPPPPASPVPVTPVVTPAEYPETFTPPSLPGGGFDFSKFTTGCPGNQTDCIAKCYQNGSQICMFGSTVPESKDPFNVCTEGTKKFEDTFEILQGDDACFMMLDKHNVPKGVFGSFGSSGSGGSPGVVNCVLTCIPC